MSNDSIPTRWNRTLSKAFDVSREEFPPASIEEALVSKYLGVEIKHLERRELRVMSVRMGAFLTAVNEEVGKGARVTDGGGAVGWSVDDIRNLDWQGRETTPLYETIQLNSTLSGDFLVDGMRFLRQGDVRKGTRATLRVEPRWYGLQLTAYGLRSGGTAQMLLDRIRTAAQGIHFLKGEAFSLSGEFLPKTDEDFDDLFLSKDNAAAITRVIRLINERGKALENRGVLLMGPPGTGKTLSARILRNQAQATFIWVSARDFHYAGSFGGFTEAFDLARECAPSVVVFEDVDNWLYDTTVDLLKTEMDGVARSTGVVTMMTTNYPELLPAALIDRPGRFHDVLKFDLPDAEARKRMLLRWLPGLATTDLAKAVEATAGYSGAHVRELARFAQIISEQDNLPLAAALAVALTKLAEQRDLITSTQRSRSHYRMPPELVAKCGVRIIRSAAIGRHSESLPEGRGFSTLQVKAFDEDRRTFTGIATTPTPDRVGDIIEPLGVEFTNPIPLLLYHDHTKPVGEVVLGAPTQEGVPFTATIPHVTESGALRERVEEAWQSVKARLLSKVSVGFRLVDDQVERLASGGLRFLKTEVLELSLVAVPANAEAVITGIKSVTPPDSAASGRGQRGTTQPSSGVTDPVTRTVRKDARIMKTITEQISAFEATRQAKSARMSDLMTAAGDKGETLDAAQEQEYDSLDADVKSVDAHLVRLRALETANKAAAVPVVAHTPAHADASRGGHVITVKNNLPPGIEFARMVLCKLASFISQGSVSPMDVAKGRYPDNPRIQQYFMKAAVPAGTTSDPVWAAPLVDPTNLASEFLAFLRPDTIVGKFGTGSVPSLRRVPFNVRITGQASGGSAYWVGQGAPKPLTSFAFNAQTLLWAKIAAIAVITEELARFSSPSAETLVRDALKDAIIERMDVDFIDPAQAAVAGVNPASITNGLVALSSAGSSADNVRTDIQNLLESFIAANQNVAGLAIIMPNTLALALSLLVNTLGQREFPDLTMNGGTLLGIPVVTSQYAANASGFGNLVIAVNTRFVALADDDQVTVDASREASLQMLDNPTNNAATATATTMVSMFQTNSIALRAERFINWGVLRAGAVVYMDDVNWGAIGSPA